MRDYQYKTHQWMQGKAWDACTPVGPYLVTADELDITKQRISTTVNGEKVQDSSIDLLIFPIAAADRDDLRVHRPRAPAT